MTTRQKRELLLLIIAVLAGTLLGILVRPYLQKDRQSAIPNSANAGAPASRDSMAKENTPLKPIADDEVVAKVDGKEINGTTLKKYLRFHIGASGMGEDSLTDDQELFLRRLALNQIIEEPIIEEEAKKRGLRVSDEDIQAFLNEARSAFPSEEEFQKDIVETLGINFEELKEFSRKIILRDKLTRAMELQEEITEEDLNKRIAELEKLMETHPGGKVPLPSREELREELEMRKKSMLFGIWLTNEKKKHDIKILDPTLEAPPLSDLGAVGNPHELPQTEKPVPH